MPDTSPSHDLLIENLAEVATPEGTTPRRGADQGRVARRRGVEVLCRDGLIAFVGTPEERRRECGECEDAERLDGQGGTLIPGFVDPHTHLPWAGTREEEFISRLAGTSYQEIAAAGGGILSTVAATRRASAGELTANVRRRLDLMLAWGTTTAEAKSGYGLNLEDELKQLAAIREAAAEHPVDLVPTLLAAHEVPVEHRGSAASRARYLDLICEEIIPAAAAAGLARFCDVFCENGVFDAAESRRVLKAGVKAGLLPRLHADEFADSGGAELASEL
ncbi:MAG TPA: imidazolonepropionase, partial [Thermoanaerobaculia bacterium]|nr:imidazolonepropionase [Thermoanaerobaculia bacterium]